MIGIVPGPLHTSLSYLSRMTLQGTYIHLTDEKLRLLLTPLPRQPQCLF